MPASGFSRFTLGGDGGVAHKLSFDVTNGVVKWALKFEAPGASSATPVRGADPQPGSLTQPGPILLRSSGAAVKVSGRVRHTKSNKERSFVVSMDDAKKVTLDVTDLSTDRSSVSDLFDQTSPVGFWRILITASDFSDFNIPQIASIRIEAICADKPTKSTCNIPGNAVLIRGSVFFAAPSASGSDKEEELFIDHITLIDADVYIPGEDLRAPIASPLKPSPPTSPLRHSSSQQSVDSTSRFGGAIGNSRHGTGINLGHTRIDEGSNVLAVGSHRQRSSFLFSYLFSTRVLMVLFFAFVAWALTYTSTITKTEALYSFAAVIVSAVAATLASQLAQALTRKPMLNARTFFVNSYNAWGYCGTVRQGERLPMFAMPSVLVRAFHDGSPSLDINMGVTAGAGRQKNGATLASDMFTCLADRSSRVGLVAGFLSQREQFGCIATNDSYEYLSVRCACDGVLVRPSRPSTSSQTTPPPPPPPMATDWLYLQPVRNVDEVEPLAQYMVTSGRYNSARVRMFMQGQRMRETPPSGWCSWYHFFSNIREENLVSNAEAMVAIKHFNGLNSPRHGFDLFQIDDGYQRAWGDWLQLDKQKFPAAGASGSLASMVKMIKDKGMVPGIWIAPFAVDKHSQVAREHPSWILRQSEKSNSKPANSANCGKWFYGLDVTNPEVQAHVRDSISTMTSDWGFQYLKLDFLYCAALADAQKSYFDRTLTRAQAMQVAMQAVTQSAGPYTYLLGCGAPMGAVIGHVHANRVSADAGLNWFPEFPLPSFDKWNLPSARSMVRNTICRMSMHARWWVNDPDCMLLRRTTSFTDDEIVGIATVKAMSGGSFVLSDDLAVVPEDRMRIAHQLLPATNQSAVAVDLLDSDMPELLRLGLALDADPWSCRGGGAGAVGEVVSCLSAWTLLAVCNWSEDRKSHRVSLASSLGHALYSELLEMDSSSASSGGSSSSNSSSCSGASGSSRGSGGGGCEGPVLVHLFDFWTSEYSFIVLGDSGSVSDNARQAVLRFPSVAPHSARLYALRVMLDPLLPMYVGSNLHFTSGLEVASFRVVCSTQDEASADGRPSAEGTAGSGSGSPLDDGESVTRTWVCSIDFEAGAVRDHAWKGFVWVYLPLESAFGLRLSGSAVEAGPGGGKGAKQLLSEVASIVVPLSGRRGVVVKIAVGRQGETSPSDRSSSGPTTLGKEGEGDEASTDHLDITWTDTVPREVADAEGLRRGHVVFRS